MDSHRAVLSPHGAEHTGSWAEQVSCGREEGEIALSLETQGGRGRKETKHF